MKCLLSINSANAIESVGQIIESKQSTRGVQKILRMAIVKLQKKKPSTKPKKAKVKVKTETKPDAISHQLKKRIARKNKKPDPRGVVYIKHLPHGFYEEELRKFFSQFGKVTRIRVVRSPKTTRSKGYAFVEFLFPEVAQIAAETMNNYMMFTKVIKTTYIPPEEVKYNVFRSSMVQITDETTGKKVLTSKKIIKRDAAVEKLNSEVSEEQLMKRQGLAAKKARRLKKKLAAMEIDYDVDEVVPEKILNAKIKSKKPKLAVDEIKEESDSETDYMPAVGSDLDDVKEPINEEHKKKSLKKAKSFAKTLKKEKEAVKNEIEPESVAKSLKKKKKLPKEEPKITIKMEKSIKKDQKSVKKMTKAPLQPSLKKGTKKTAKKT